MSRGFAAIGLHQPKYSNNVGEVLRACGCYGAASLMISGSRYSRANTDTQSAFKHLPLIQCEHLKNVIPFGATPIAVDLVEDAEPLPTFKHPTSAFYIFGPEDGTLGDDILSWCEKKICVPTRYCMNLAATVNVVLYDRMSKQFK